MLVKVTTIIKNHVQRTISSTEEQSLLDTPVSLFLALDLSMQIHLYLQQQLQQQHDLA
jgi:hypothetical protein